MSRPNKRKNNGDDAVFGGDGPQFLSGGNGADVVAGGSGHDILLGENGDDVLIGGPIGPQVILEDDDYLHGGNGDDILRGGHGQDTLLGGNGDDLLAGEAGANLLTGGHGDDIFRFGYTAPRMPNAGLGQDTITDFGDGDDIIDVQGLNAARNTTSDIPFVFIGEEAFSGTQPELRYRHEGMNTVIELDTIGIFQNPDGVADGTITLVGIHVLFESNFML